MMIGSDQRFCGVQLLMRRRKVFARLEGQAPPFGGEPRYKMAALSVGSHRKPSGQAGGSREQPSARPLTQRLDVLRLYDTNPTDRTATPGAVSGSRLPAAHRSAILQSGSPPGASKP